MSVLCNTDSTPQLDSTQLSRRLRAGIDRAKKPADCEIKGESLTVPDNPSCDESRLPPHEEQENRDICHPRTLRGITFVSPVMTSRHIDIQSPTSGSKGTLVTRSFAFRIEYERERELSHDYSVWHF